MSATGRSDVRFKDDFYSTPKSATRAILPHLELGASVLDPCAGTGAILDVVRESSPRVERLGYEIDNSRYYVCSEHHRCGNSDALAHPPQSWGGPTSIVTNPPFSLSLEFVTRSLSEVAAGGTVAFLLRLNWLASAGRKDFHRNHPSDVYVLPSRPEFAASIKCKGTALRSSCGWHIMLPIEAERPTLCPACLYGKVSVTTTDSTEYAWFVWGEGRGNRWFLLDL